MAGYAGMAGLPGMGRHRENQMCIRDRFQNHVYHYPIPLKSIL